LAGVGTTNLDNRSFFSSFEVMTFAVECDRQRSATSPDLVESVEKMLEDEFEVSCLVNLEEYQPKPFWFRLSTEMSHLSAPIL
jgi:cardiolipin synthase